jgi:hypothetical protein
MLAAPNERADGKVAETKLFSELTAKCLLEALWLESAPGGNPKRITIRKANPEEKDLPCVRQP